MRYIILFFALFLAFSAIGQTKPNVTKDKEGNYIAISATKAPAAPATLESLTKNCEVSAAKYVDKDGTRHNVYLSKAGKVFIVVTSKAGKLYRKYLQE